MMGASMDDDTRRRQRALWDRTAASLPDLYGAPTTQYYRRAEIALFQRAFGDLAGKRLLKLDLWNEAINTRILHWAQERGCHVTGMDLSGVVARRARENGRHLPLVQADIRDLPFQTGSFDLVYTMGTIEHIDEYQRAVSEVHRVLKVGGRAIIGVPHKWDLYLRPLCVQVLESMGQYLYSPEKSFSTSELRHTVENSGLRVVQRTGLLSMPWFLRMADLFFYSRNIPLWRLSPLLTKPFEVMESAAEWPAAFRYLVAVVAEKRA
ncbi:MAG: class I SAM-dependent methyltransferase [Myxococcota bacterium]